MPERTPEPPASDHDVTQTVLVQGASRGIGLAFVRAMLARGDRVIGTSRDPECAALTALGVPIVPVDLTDAASLAGFGERVRAHTDRLDALYNVSGVLHTDRFGPEKRVEQLELDVMHEVFAVNAFGPALVTKAVFPLLDHEHRAVVVNLSARVGSIGDNRAGGWYSYRASKAAQNQLTRTLAIEFRRRAKNLIVIGLHPGTVDTELSRPFQRNVPEDKLFDRDWAARRLLTVVDGLGPSDSGEFFAWDGSPIPW